ncbi:MAG: GNAT family protein [Acidimicrobiales bacterium]
MDLDDFLRQIDRLAPGGDHSLDTEVATLPVVQRIAITRWLADRLERPVDLDVVSQHRTLGDAWRWLDEVQQSDEPTRGADPLRHRVGESSRVRLRPLVEEDLGPLYLASFDPVTANAWRYRGRTMSPTAFLDSVHEGVRAQYVVESVAGREAFGLVSAYDHSSHGLHCKVAFLRFGARPPGSGGAVIEGMLLFISHLFDTFPYRKVFAEVPDYNMGLFAEGLAQQEGVLRDYLFHAGHPADLHIVSFRRDQWEQVRDATGW